MRDESGDDCCEKGPVKYRQMEVYGTVQERGKMVTRRRKEGWQFKKKRRKEHDEMNDKKTHEYFGRMSFLRMSIFQGQPRS